MLLRIFNLITLLSLTTLAFLLLSACSQQKDDAFTEKHVEPPLLATTANTNTTAVAEDNSLSEIDAYVILDNDKTTISGTGASFENNVLTITKGGDYYLTGTLSDGKIHINSSDEAKKVKLTLASVNISCSTDAPFYVENSPDETIIILQNGSKNYFSDTSRTVDETLTDYATAAIYSKDDLQIEGDGELIVTGNFGKGIFSKNDIDIRGGNIQITATDDGIRGKDSIEIEDGTISITCGGDGIRTSEELEEGKGIIDIYGGAFNITSDLDAIQATGEITISEGIFSLTSGGGATENSNYQNQSFPTPGKMGNNFSSFSSRPDSSLYGEVAPDAPSAKGIKSDKSLTLSGGTFTLNCLDDSLHSPVITIDGGDYLLASDDDGIHGDEAVTINNGSIIITKSYEGVESKAININGGTILSNSADDGFNAASTDASATATNRNKQGDFNEGCQINMTDGYLLLVSEGDGIDSNGSVTLTGGKMIVFGPARQGNGALDYGGSFTVTNGTLLAIGSGGMAQSVNKSQVPVFSFDLNGEEKSSYTIADSNNNCIISFTSPKTFSNIVFASDNLKENTAYSIYKDGSVSNYSQSDNGIFFDGVYSPGQLLGTLS